MTDWTKHAKLSSFLTQMIMQLMNEAEYPPDWADTVSVSLYWASEARINKALHSRWKKDDNGQWDRAPGQPPMIVPASIPGSHITMRIPRDVWPKLEDTEES